MKIEQSGYIRTDSENFFKFITATLEANNYIYNVEDTNDNIYYIHIYEADKSAKRIEEVLEEAKKATDHALDLVDDYIIKKDSESLINAFKEVNNFIEGNVSSLSCKDCNPKYGHYLIRYIFNKKDMNEILDMDLNTITPKDMIIKLNNMFYVDYIPNPYNDKYHSTIINKLYIPKKEDDMVCLTIFYNKGTPINELLTLLMELQISCLNPRYNADIRYSQVGSIYSKMVVKLADHYKICKGDYGLIYVYDRENQPIRCSKCGKLYDSFNDLASDCIYKGSNDEDPDHPEYYLCSHCGEEIIVLDKSDEFKEDNE